MLGDQMGSTVRVIVIDRNDCIVREWKCSRSVGCPALTQGSPLVRSSRDEGRWLASQSGHAGHGLMWIEGDLPTTKANLAPRCRR
jgi:hypothetical protein